MKRQNFMSLDSDGKHAGTRPLESRIHQSPLYTELVSSPMLDGDGFIVNVVLWCL